MPKLKILKSGMLTTLQDNGRMGYVASGVPIGGALDKRSYWLANALVGNHENMPAIEVTLLGPKIEFELGGIISITGADLSPSINGIGISMNTKHKVQSGSVLSFGKCISGCRSYIAVKGEWKVKKWLGSVSPLLLNIEGWPQPGLLEVGRVIEVIDDRANDNSNIELSILAKTNENSVLNLMAGPERNHFSAEAINQLSAIEYKISSDSNRMGYRLMGSPLTMKGVPEMISSGVIPGTVQISNAGLPIVMLADAQTVGGYPRIAYLPADDQYKLAQMKPGETVRFQFKN
jgi:antagonist of KipI